MFNQVNVITDDIDAAAAAYRVVGVDMPDAPEWPPGTGARHTGTEADGVAHFDLDNAAMARLWAPEWDDPKGVVLGISVPSAEDVDKTYAAAVEAGCESLQSPYDAFFGARYAMVRTPDGNPVGLMGPRDRSKGYIPG